MRTSQSGKNKTNTIGRRFITSNVWQWSQKVIVLIIFSLVVNHLASQDSFPTSESYRFPVEGFLSSIALCILIGFVAELNFRYYQKTYFSRKVEVDSIIRFMASTLGYIAIMYVPVNILFNIIAGSQTEFYYMLIGLVITLLVSFILIGLLYAQDIYNLYNRSIKGAEITIEVGGKMTKVRYNDIACFYTENKIVYSVAFDGSSMITNFTLNELEEKINDQLFFRANRKMIVHKDAVDQVEKIENGKLRIRLVTSINNESFSQITISRYKQKEFLNWYR